MVQQWTPVAEKFKYGIVICNFNLDKVFAHRLQLSVGDTVYIDKESGNWYYGSLNKSRTLFGVFPKNYVIVKDSITDRTGTQEVLLPRELPIVQEITMVLREWGDIWKEMYINRNPNFETIREMMQELIELRSQVMSGKLPLDELKEVKRKVTTTIDNGNALLVLDLVVRDEQGNILNPDKTSTIDLFDAHEAATLRINLFVHRRSNLHPLSEPSLTKEMSSTRHYSYNFYVMVNNFVCRIGEDAQLLMTLYDGKELKFISENYYIKWGKNGFVYDLDQLNNLKVLFCDLGSRDLLREKVLLVCQVVRIGVMELKEPDQQLKVRSTFHPSKKAFDGIRRPFGVAALDITHLLKNDNEADETEIFIPFVQCGEKDSLDSLIKKIVSQKSEISEKEHKGQGLFVFAKLLPGDLKYVRESNSHLVSPLTPLARKMGFPEVILPGDVRNDLYLTLMTAEFVSKTSKANNVEVTVRVCNEHGQTLNGVITFGAGADFTSEYKSVVYYHDERPKWMETIKISVPVEACDQKCHLKFTFKHRSSNESKDKNEKPFGFSFIKLMNEDGTTLKDQRHELLLYKIDSRRFDENDPSLNYLNLPSTRSELDTLWRNSTTQISNYKALSSQYNVPGLTLVPKDSFEISTIICSTKLTQNIHLLGLLKWSPSNIPTDDDVKRCLNTLMRVDGEEIVKFLQDILDALFTVLVAKDSEEFNSLLFTALIFIIGLISDRKYEHFRPVLDAYIAENFSSTLAYSKLIVVLKQYINGLIDGSIDCSLDSRIPERRMSIQQSTFQETPLQAMKSLEFLFRFIVKSRSLCAKLNGGGGRQEFEKSLSSLLRTLTQLMLPESKATIVVQAACLKYFPSAIPDILTVFDGKDLSVMLTELINSVPLDKLKTQRMACILDIIHYECLLKDAECRSILLPVFNDHVRILMKEGKELPQCIKVLRAILTLLHGRDPQEIRDDIADLMLSLLPTVIKAVVKMDRGDALIGSLVSIMIGIFRQMTPYHFDTYIEHVCKYGTQADLLDFLMELIIVFKDLVSQSVYPDDWNEMIMLQNNVILNTLKEFSQRMKNRFLQPFEYQLWNNFFHCAIAFLTQKHLQLENFSVNKRNKIISRYKDMRTATALLIRSVWVLLGGNRLKFIPSMIGPFLEMALIPEIELRKSTIPIFFDMMQCEFLSPKGSTLSCSNLDVSSINAGDYRGHFNECEHEMISQLDKLVEGGKGDENFKDLFCEIIPSHIQNFFEMYDQGMKFVSTVERLMRRLLAYRTVVNEENKENRMICIVNLLEFYQKIGRQEMHIRYLYKLCDLHLECENYTEAAFALLLHTKLLTWTDDLLSLPLKNDKYPECETHRELKEKLYKEIIDYFDKGKLWEAGLRVCNELVGQYKNETIDYIELSALLLRMSQFYDNIMKQIRHKPEYFRVSYWGKGFPAFLQNRTFINRGKAYEKLPEFSGRLLNQFPNAQLMNSLAFPDKEITESNGEYLQINKVDPIMELSDKFKGKPIHNQILKYYEVNEVKQFSYSRPFRKTPHHQSGRASDNEFANMWIERTTLTTKYPLPGIMTWFETVRSESRNISPIENAIETMESINNEIKNLIMQHTYEQNIPLNQLTMRLNGVVDAAVMGGIINYEKAFFTADFMNQLTSDAERENVNKLKDLIAAQIPLLDIGIQIHGQRAPISLKPLHEHMQESFYKLRQSVESKYGKRSPPKELQDCTIVKIRRTLSKNEGNRKPVSCPGDVKTDRDISKHSSIISITSSQTLKPIRSMSVWCRPSSSTTTTTLTTNTLSKLKKQLSKENDLNNANNRKSGHSSHSQWYLNDSATEIEVPNRPDTNRSSSVSTQSSLIELTEQLTPQRPLRQVRPTSGQYLRASTPNRSLSHGTSTSSLSNQIIEVDSVDDVPPPLPVKSGFADYTNFPGMNGSANRTLTKQNSSNTLKLKNKPPPPPPQTSPLLRRHSSTPNASDSYDDIPPELPEKPSKRLLPARLDSFPVEKESVEIITGDPDDACDIINSSL